jgi:PfaD family protein
VPWFNQHRSINGYFIPSDHHPESGWPAIQSALERITRPVYLLEQNGSLAVSNSGFAGIGDFVGNPENSLPLRAYAPPLKPEDWGDARFKQLHGLRYAYVCGAMANGITSVEMLKAAGRAGMIGFFGAAGLSLVQVAAAIDQLQGMSDSFPYGFNLIHSPHDPLLESELVNLYIQRGIRRVSASAYLDLTLPLIYFRVKGIHRQPDGRIVCPNQVIGKISRVEVARKFFSPPAEKHLRQLIENKWITPAEATLAREIPVAEAITAEADSGGHTDNRPAISLLPTMLALRDEMMKQHRFQESLCVGLGGGIATPDAVAAAFAMGAAYILTGSINQACMESGTSDTVRHMLAEAQQADVAMAPAADMFELGVKVQVLKRGTMFFLKAAKLYELYRAYACYEEIPESQRLALERDFFRRTFEEEWESTRAFFRQRDPHQIQRAENDPKHKMALVFRSYLGQSSNWANSGEPSRKIDYQIWCGPAMGAFNEWVRGSFMEQPQNRRTVTVAMNLLYGACVLTRARWLNIQGIELPYEVGRVAPLPLASIQERLMDS